MNVTSAFDPKKTTIVFVLPSLTAGGAERALITLMNNIDRTYFDPAFIAISDYGPMRCIIDPSIPVHNLKSKRVSLSLPKLYFKLKALKPDIVVSTMAHMNLTLLLLKPFFPQTRFIIREAITPSFSLNEHPFFAPLLKLAYRTLYPSAHRIISPAQIIIDEFQTLLKMPCNNHRLLYNFVDTDRIRASEKEPFPLAENRKNTVRFVAAGRLHPQKGFGRLLLALSSFETRYEWQLTIFGEGPRREYLQELIQKYNLSDRIHLPGLSDNPWPYFAAADCFLLPSRWEGLPNVALESLACGTPVIASEEAGGIHEIAKLSPPGSIILAKTMDDFIKAMQAVQPSAHAKFRDSLLPPAFQKETVIRCFESILKED